MIEKYLQRIPKREILWMLDEIIAKRKHPIPILDNIDKFILELSQKEQQKLRYWIDCRYNSKPLQYILQSQQFLTHSIVVRPPVLIPRWETEEWVDTLIRSMDTFKKLKILDLCSGSGCISIALSHAFPNSTVDAIDISPQCIRLGKLNARKNSCKNVSFHQRDVMHDLSDFQGYDLVVSNPPYITPSEYQVLDRDVKEWESPIALVTKDEKGIEFYERIVSQSYLFKKHAKLVFEIGEQQGLMVKKLMESNGFTATVHKDSAGRDRCIIGDRI